MKSFESILIAILLLLAITSNSLPAENRPTIELGIATLALGMQKEVVSTYLKDRQMQLTPTHTEEDAKLKENSFWVSFKGSLPHEHLGQIIFHKGKLVYISKYWGQFDNKDAFSFVRTLFSVLSETTKSKNGEAVIRVSTYPQPKYESKNIDISIGPYEVNINCIDYHESPVSRSVSVTQYLKDYRNLPWK